ncbi:MAG: hypothetical protein C4547_15285 [Phycisphaerales bacterium]|nr:MAG: hypothetical protein C4547_15285 [Phycisphaerales bacterium]
MAPAAMVHSELQGEERPFHELRVTLHAALGILSVRRWFFFVPFCIAASAVFVGSLRLPRTYTASTRFERRDDPVFMELPKSPGTGDFSLFRQTLERDITSPDYMAEVVDHLGLVAELPRHEDGTLTPAGQQRATAVGQGLAGCVSVISRERMPHLDLIEVIYSGPDPTIGPRLVDEIKTTYIRRTKGRIREFLEQQQSWYTERLDEATRRVAEAQEALNAIKLEHPYADNGNAQALAQRYEELAREKRELQMRRNSLIAEIAAEEQFLAVSVAGAAVGPAATLDDVDVPYSEASRRLATRIERIETQIEDLRITRGMTDLHPMIQSLRAESAATRDLFHAQREQDHKAFVASAGRGVTPDGVQDAWSPQRAKSQISIDALKRQLQYVDEGLTSNADRTARLDEARTGLLNDHDTIAMAEHVLTTARAEAQHYQSVLNKIVPVLRANDLGHAVNFDEERSASGSRVAVNPRTKTIVLAAIFAGICAGVVFAILAELVDHVYRSSTQVAKSLGLSVLETIDVIVTGADRRRRLVRRLVVAPIVVTLGLGALSISGLAAYLSLQDPIRYERLRHWPTTLLGQYVAPIAGAGAPAAP